jgi:glycosyltransferase involved in cell wall biosynthesis
VSDDDAFFATPDDAGALAAMIRFVLERGDEAQQRATHARRTVEGYSWSARAGRILVQLKKLV